MNDNRIKRFSLLFVLLFVILLSYLVFGLNRPTAKQAAIDNREETKTEKEAEEEKEAEKEKEAKEKEEQEKLEEAKRIEEEKKRKEEEEKEAEKEENKGSVIRTENVISYESIPYETERKDDPNLLKGTESVSKTGAAGEITIVTLVTYKDDEKIKEEVIDRYTSKDPVTEVILVGTKEPVKIEEVEEVEVFEIDYPIRAYDNPEMYVGENEVQQQGVKGEKTIKYLVTYEDGVETKREFISEAITKDPVPEIIHTGIKIREGEDPELQ